MGGGKARTELENGGGVDGVLASQTPASQMAAALSPSLRQARGEGRVKEDRSDLVGADITAEGDKKLRGDKKLYIHASIHSYIQTCIQSHIGLLKNANISSIS